ncbi:hypothetical protein MCQ_01263 [Candidatus Bartonella washoeensis Sb944nv]|uniref:Bartonella effector protein BID domain-containing protein n=1 Tax=Candidatus Bartonella washoeensis Sb944nv TaxID=1094563 RepID=J0YUB9_9HYPH|nr:BID domain-containing T4SS effector [Bartonella washoeensis]EJF78543.1 hypothetical protein MCQ_01263 [Bartonella washoeensis Sb944nv]
MKKNQSAPSANLSVKELKKRYEQPISDTSPKVSRSADASPKDKRQPHTPENQEKLQKRHEQSSTMPEQSVPQAPLYATPAPQQPVGIAPQRPPRLKDKERKKPNVQESKALNETSASQQPIRMAPKRPPRLKDKELKKPNVQEGEALNETPAPPKPPRTHVSEQKRAPSRQEDEEIYATPRPQTPPRTHVSEQKRAPSRQEDEEIYATPRPQTPPRLKDKEKPNVQEGEALNETPAPPKPPRTYVSEQKRAPSRQEDEEIYATPRPQTPPRTHVSEQKRAPSQQEDEEIYATPRPQTPPRTHVSEQKRASSQQADEELYATARPQTPTRTHKTSANTMERMLLIDAYEEEIRHWCGIVYGDRLVLDKRLQEVRENPAMGEQLSWEVSEKPEYISKLAGKKMLGLKTKARKAAEENFSSLCDAINGFTYTLKYTQQSTVQVSEIEQNPHEEQSTQNVQKVENLEQPPSPEKEREPLSLREIADRVQKDPSVLYGQAEIRYWCKLVYNDPLLLQDRTEDIQKVPVMGEELAWQVSNNPTCFSKLAGKQMLGIKSSARKTAEENLSTLCIAIEDYTNTVKQVREKIVQEHQAQQNDQRQSPRLAQNLQKQQTLSQPPKLPEKTVTARRDAAETSRQEQQNPPDVRPRKVGKAQGIAFTH